MNSSEEIQCLTYKPSMQLELQYGRLTHEQDYNLRPQLYKVNELSQEEMCKSLCTLMDSSTEPP